MAPTQELLTMSAAMRLADPPKALRASVRSGGAALSIPMPYLVFAEPDRVWRDFAATKKVAEAGALAKEEADLRRLPTLDEVLAARVGEDHRSNAVLEALINGGLTTRSPRRPRHQGRLRRGGES